jgi:hypothetical protein
MEPIASVVIFLASVAAASDESAWILWIKHDYDAALEGEWTVMHRRATREQCISELREEFADAIGKFRSHGLTKATETMEQSASRGSILVVGRGHAIAAKCLPDTVDPQRPKAR